MILEVKSLRLGRGENEREPWRARAARVKRERGMIYYAFHFARMRGLQPPAGPPYKVTLTRVSPGAGIDTDNLVGAFKNCRDQVTISLGLKRTDRRGRESAADGPNDPISFSYAQEKGPWGVRVEVET